MNHDNIEPSPPQQQQSVFPQDQDVSNNNTITQTGESQAGAAASSIEDHRSDPEDSETPDAEDSGTMEPGGGGGNEQWWLETQALNISTNYELVVFAMAMFSQQQQGQAPNVETPSAEWAPGSFRHLDHDTLLETCAVEALQEWWVTFDIFTLNLSFCYVDVIIYDLQDEFLSHSHFQLSPICSWTWKLCRHDRWSWTWELLARLQCLLSHFLILSVKMSKFKPTA